VRVVCGSFWGRTGPVDGISAEPIYLDVSVPAGLTKRLPVETTRHAFAYIFEGSGRFADASDPRPIEIDHVDDVDAPPISAEELGDRTLVSFGRGDEVVVRAGEHGIRFLLVSGKPIQEPVAWAGPIVMNTREELKKAFAQLNDGTFLDGP
jgi:quercetin 2,3-dioxygenase